MLDTASARCYARLLRGPRGPRRRLSNPYVSRLRCWTGRGCVAQLVEQLTLNQLVVGSIPTAPTNLFKDLATSYNRLEGACGSFAGVPVKGSPKYHQFRLGSIPIDDTICCLNQTRQLGG